MNSGKFDHELTDGFLELMLKKTLTFLEILFGCLFIGVSLQFHVLLHIG
jgi:hypothetical protein